jgi:isopenicillin N synthase-like dioxygenase
MQLDIQKSPNFKGYTGLMKENNNPENLGDLHEGFDIGWEDPITSAVRDGGGMDGKNVWPGGLPGFRDSVMDY